MNLTAIVDIFSMIAAAVTVAVAILFLAMYISDRVRTLHVNKFYKDQHQIKDIAIEDIRDAIKTLDADYAVTEIEEILMSHDKYIKEVNNNARACAASKVINKG